MNSSFPFIQASRLEKVYHPYGDAEQVVRALDGIDLVIEKGDYVSIMGPSGSGKSTLMQILGLLDRSSSGKYLLKGQDVSALSDEELADLRSREIGFIFQFFNLLPRTSCIDNVALPMLYSGNADPKVKSVELLNFFGLGDRLFHKPHQLSGGQQQRVAIARSLANDPEILFADEPTGNINTEQAAEVLDLLDTLNHKGVTIIVVTHELEVAQRARRMITIRDGKIAADTRILPVPSYNDQSKFREDLKNTLNKKNILEIVQENLRMAIVALSLNKLRTALATLGIVIGISSVVAMIAIGEGAQKAISEQLSAFGTNLLNIRPIGSLKVQAGSKINSRRFTLDDFEKIKSMVNENSLIKAADAKVYGDVVIAYGAENTMADIIGVSPQSERMENNVPVVGRFFTNQENQIKARVALLGQTIVRNLFGEDINPVGSRIKINRIDYTVIGVLPPKGATAFQDRDNVVIIPLYTAMYRVLGRKKVQNLTVEVRDQSLIPEAKEELSGALRKQRKIPAHRENDFEIRNLNEIQDIYNRTTSIISSMLAAIAAVSLLVGGIGIMNVMLVSVKERTREVGLRKALGAKEKYILLQFLMESMLIGLIGGCIGVVGGYFLAHAAAFFFGWPPMVPLSAVIWAVLFSLVVGVIFGIWPAKQAAKLSPIEALRYE